MFLNQHNVAQLCHEANRAYCRSIGDDSQPSWKDAPEWQRQSAIEGVLFHMQNPNADASASHQNWYNAKLADGWSYGPEKNPDRRQHPCMVPFGELPIAQQVKDHIFRSIVHAAVEASSPL